MLPYGTVHEITVNNTVPYITTCHQALQYGGGSGLGVDNGTVHDTAGRYTRDDTVAAGR